MLTSQPELTKLYNENIGGHRYTFTTSSKLVPTETRMRLSTIVVSINLDLHSHLFGDMRDPKVGNLHFFRRFTFL